MPADPEHSARFFTYQFDDGTEHTLLPADEGGWSLEGLAHAATITTNFFVEGKLRRRAPYSDAFRIFIGPPRAGSWISDFYISLERPDVWAGAVAGFAVGSISQLFSVFKRLANRATGVDPDDKEGAAFEERRSGDFDALVEAVEPSLKRAHRVIIDRDMKLQVRLGPASFTFDRHTRAYIEESLVDQRATSARVNVASYNVNSRHGRVYFEELGRTVPFYIARGARPATEVALGRSLQNYTENRIANHDIDVDYIGVRAADDRIKSIIILSAAFILGSRA